MIMGDVWYRVRRGWGKEGSGEILAWGDTVIRNCEWGGGGRSECQG